MADLAQNLLKYLKPKESKVGSRVFRIISSGSVALCLTAAALTVASSYFGDPITCNQGTTNSLSDDYVKNYCWIHGTNLISKNNEDLFPCAASYYEKDEDIKNGKAWNPDLSYYQWTGLILLLQAGIFYIPKLIWQHKEKGLAKEFNASNTSRSTINFDEEKYNQQIERFVRYFMENINMNNSLFWGYVFCEFSSILSVVMNFLIVNSILLGRFADYGFLAWSYYTEHYTKTDLRKPMCDVFPTVVSCDLGTVGASGGKEENNVLCILNQNTINEKTFLVLYFWYIFLFILGSMLLLYRIAMLAIPASRAPMIYAKVKNFQYRTKDQVRLILSKCQIGDWFILLHIGNNVDPHFYKEFLGRLADKFNSGNKHDSAVELKRFRDAEESTHA